jgi:hypothetical protein
MDLEAAAQVSVPLSPDVGGVFRKAEMETTSPSDIRLAKKVRADIEAAAEVAEGRGETRSANAPSPSMVPDSKKQRELAGLAVCALTVVGSSLDVEGPYDEPDVPRGASTQEATQEEEYEVPTLVAEVPTKVVYGTRSGEVLPPEHVQKGRQRELDSLMRHRVVEEVPNGSARSEGKHVQGGWVEDYKKFPDVRSRFVAKQIAYGQREDVTQSTPALMVFRLLLALAACGFVGAEACFAVFDISVAFLHSVMDEVVFVHPPKGDGLVRPGFCWRLRKAMYGTRRASRLWADKVKLVLEKAGCTTLRTMSMVFWHPVLRFVLAVWGDDFGAIGTKEAIDSLERILMEAFECKTIGVVGPHQGLEVKLLNRVIAWSPRGFRWHTDPRHAKVVCEIVGLVPGESKAAGTPGSRGGPGDASRDAEDDLDEWSAKEYASASGSLLYHALDRPDIQFATGRCMSAISAPKVKHQGVLKGVARYLCDKVECAWLYDYQEKMPNEVTILTDADWATNPENRRSVDCVHIYFGKSLIEASSCTQQVVALSSGESEFYGLLRGAACGLQVRELLKEMGLDMAARVLTDSAAARGVVRRTGSGRVKHLEARWLWIQERVRSGDVVVGCVDTSLNTSDLGTKFLTKRRFEELLAMMPLRLGVGLLAIGKAEGKRTEDEEDDNYFYLFVLVVCLGLASVAFVLGCMVGTSLSATTSSLKDHEKKNGDECTFGKVNNDTTENRETDKNGDLDECFDGWVRILTVAELQAVCLAEGFSPGRATKECMRLALLQKMSQQSKKQVAKTFRDVRRRTR